MIDVDEVYTLEVKTLSIEDQHQIKRRKKALKRSHNRLNRVKRIMEKISSNENDDTKGKDDTSVALIRSNASQEQLQYVTTKAQYLHNATNNKLADVSRKDGDIKIEMDPSLPEVLGTPTVFSENQKKETIDCISKISDDDDVKFAEMEEKTRGTIFPNIFHYSANHVNDLGSFTTKEVHKSRVLLSNARVENACPYENKSVDHDYNSCSEGLQTFSFEV